MIDVLVRAAIDAADENVRPRLRRCLPMLLAAVADWGGSPVGDITLACATPRHAMVLHADGDWPELDEAKFQKGDVALALVGAIESHKSDGIIAGTAVLLGEAGLAAARADHERISKAGATPLVVTLVECDGSSVTMMTTTIAMPPATVH